MKTTLTSGASSRHLINVALFAGIFEWYDFSIYGLMAVYIGPLFFNASSPIAEILSVYALYAVSYLARPLGGLFFGRMGDVSRRDALKLSLMTTAIPAILIGLLPTYATGGLLATGALCLLRVIQGFGMGGEFPNSICYVLDTSPKRYRTLLGSLTCASTSIGISLGSFVIFVLHCLFDEATMLAWAWRVPFLLSMPLTLYIAWIRNTLVEPEQSISITTNPPRLWRRLQEEKYNLLKIILLGAMLTTCSNLFLIWMPTYLKLFLNVSPQLATISSNTTLWFEIATLILTGYLTAFLPVERTLKVLHVSLLLLIYPLFHVLTVYSHNALILIATQLVFAFFLGSINGCFIEMISRILPYDVRSLGASVVFAVSPAFFGGSAPLISTLLIRKTGLLEAPAFLILTIGLIALPVTLSLKSLKPAHRLTH